ncbi:MAG: hypothetical protein B6244_07450 [Candidatus Cloacimonetes bacterium 4572_55]|nr:MAG: hypothetical protein B6244_07450 [Candidatus Cloacimonetes bacterium 4572_55]
MNAKFRLLILCVCILAMMTMNCECVYCTFCPDCSYCEGEDVPQEDENPNEGGEIDPNPDGNDYVLKFDGSDDVVQIKEQDMGLNSMVAGLTVEAWVYARSINTGDLVTVLDRTELPIGQNRYMLGFGKEGSTATFQVNGSTVNASGIITAGRWLHLAGVFDGYQLHVYVNGILGNTVQMSITGPFTIAESPIYIGANPNAPGEEFRGYIDEIRVWKARRSAAQIQQLMNVQLTGGEDNLIAYWRIDSGGGQTLTDYAGENDGELGTTDAVDTSDPEWVQIDFPH